MGLVFALNGLAYLAVFLVSFYTYNSLSKKGHALSKIGSILAVNGIFYLLIGVLSFLWSFGFLEPNNLDFVLASAILAVVSSVLILYAVYKITDNRNLLYLLVIFLTSVFAINFSMKAFFIATLGLSYALMAIVFLDLVFFSNYYLRRAGYFGLFYVGFSVFFALMIYFGTEAIRIFWFIPTALMFFVFLFLHLDVEHLGIVKKEGKIAHRQHFAISYAVVFGKFLLFVCSLFAFLFVSTISIHELGHALVAQYYNCGQFKAVIYDISAPHTEIRCDHYYNNVVLTLAGVAATSAVGLIFILTGSQFTFGISYLILGFGLLVSYGDLNDLGISKNINALVMSLSLVIIIASVVRISLYYLRQQEIFKDSFEEGIKKLNEGEIEAKKVLKYDHLAVNKHGKARLYS